MDSKLILFLILLNSLMFSQEKSDKLSNESVSFKYEKIQTSDYGIGVIGSNERRAYATFVESNITEKSQTFFHQIRFKSINFSKKPSEIYLCIYENDNGFPGKLLDEAKYLVTIPTLKTLITADLSKLNFKVPENGYFIGFEWVLSKENEIKGNVKTPNLPFNPTISGYTGKTANLYTKRKKWRKEPDASLVAGLALDISYLQDLLVQTQ
ncbi:hypothetical protein [Kaistella sp.]|uniref:hypothetical protein n=1 Tax=Kaistella sp. TaxID=2782235 RepID=UPI002F947ED1